MTDEQFYDALKRYLGPDAPIPVFYRDIQIDRAKTLALPCYAEIKLSVEEKA